MFSWDYSSIMISLAISEGGGLSLNMRHWGKIALGLDDDTAKRNVKENHENPEEFLAISGSRLSG